MAIKKDSDFSHSAKEVAAMKKELEKYLGERAEKLAMDAIRGGPSPKITGKGMRKAVLFEARKNFDVAVVEPLAAHPTPEESMEEIKTARIRKGSILELSAEYDHARMKEMFVIKIPDSGGSKYSTVLSREDVERIAERPVEDIFSSHHDDTIKRMWMDEATKLGSPWDKSLSASSYEKIWETSRFVEKGWSMGFNPFAGEGIDEKFFRYLHDRGIAQAVEKLSVRSKSGVFKHTLFDFKRGNGGYRTGSFGGSEVYQLIGAYQGVKQNIGVFVTKHAIRDHIVFEVPLNQINETFESGLNNRDKIYNFIANVESIEKTKKPKKPKKEKPKQNTTTEMNPMMGRFS